MPYRLTDVISLFWKCARRATSVHNHTVSVFSFWAPTCHHGKVHFGQSQLRHEFEKARMSTWWRSSNNLLHCTDEGRLILPSRIGTTRSQRAWEQQPLLLDFVSMSLLGLSGRTNGTFSHLFGTNIEWYDYCFEPRETHAMMQSWSDFGFRHVQISCSF